MNKLNLTSKILDLLGFSEYWDENGTGGCRTLTFKSGDRLRIYEQDEMDDDTEGYFPSGVYVANHYYYSGYWALPLNFDHEDINLFFLHELAYVVRAYYQKSFGEFIEKCAELKMDKYLFPTETPQEEMRRHLTQMHKEEMVKFVNYLINRPEHGQLGINIVNEIPIEHENMPNEWKERNFQMQKYIGTKQLHARPMNLGDYNNYRGWTIPANEDPAREGYLVLYLDDYPSWSPKEVFESSYRLTDNMNFGLAVEAAKQGKKVARAGWNGKGMYAVIMPGYPDGIEVNDATQKAHGIPAGTKLVYRPYWQLWTAQKDVAMWAPSGSDSLADDWTIVE